MGAIDSNKIWEKAKSLYDSLKQKEGEGSKSGELNASQVCFDNFSKKLGLSNIKITGEAASADQEAIAKSQAPLRKSLTRKNICLNKFLMQMKLPYSGKNCNQGHLLVRKRSERQDLRQEGTDKLYSSKHSLPSSIELLSPSLEGEQINTSWQPLVVQKEGLDRDNTFSAFGPWHQEALCHSGAAFQSSLDTGQCPWPPKSPTSSAPWADHQAVLLASNTTSLSQTSRSGDHQAFYRLTTHGALQKELLMLWERMPRVRRVWKPGRSPYWRRHFI